jgi:hypothetical protein
MKAPKAKMNKVVKDVVTRLTSKPKNSNPKKVTVKLNPAKIAE